MNHTNTQSAAENAIKLALAKGYDVLLEEQKTAWAKIWEMSDITIEGDVKAQQGIRFNIFQLLSLIHISEPTRRTERSRMPSSA